MKCIFISGRYDFLVQYHSPAVVKAHSRSWHVLGAHGLEEFSILDPKTAVFEPGQTAAFLPASMTKKARKILCEEFDHINPGVLKYPEGRL